MAKQEITAEVRREWWVCEACGDAKRHTTGSVPRPQIERPAFKKGHCTGIAHNVNRFPVLPGVEEVKMKRLDDMTHDELLAEISRLSDLLGSDELGSDDRADEYAAIYARYSEAILRRGPA